MFTNNWFEMTGKANFEKYVRPITTKEEHQNFLEVGCYEGQASYWMLENIPNSFLTVVDTFEGSQEHDKEFEKSLLARFKENVRQYLDSSRVEILQGTSEYHLKRLDNNNYDFIYVDGSHEASDVLADGVLAFPLLKKGGIMIFDDYTWSGGKDFYDIPRTGIDAFLLVYGDQLEVLEKNSQVIIRKK